MKLLVFHRHRWCCNSLNLISVEYRSGYSTFTIVIFLPLQTRFFCGVGIAKNTTRSCMTWTWNLIWCHFQTVGKWGIVTAWAEGPFLWEWIDIHLFFIFCFVILVITQITVVNEVKVEFLPQKTWNQITKLNFNYFRNNWSGQISIKSTDLKQTPDWSWTREIKPFISPSFYWFIGSLNSKSVR